MPRSERGAVSWRLGTHKEGEMMTALTGPMPIPWRTRYAPCYSCTRPMERVVKRVRVSGVWVSLWRCEHHPADLWKGPPQEGLI